MNDPESRPAISNTIENLSDYDTIYRLSHMVEQPAEDNEYVFDTYDFFRKDYSSILHFGKQ